MSRRGGKRNFIVNSFTLSKEHIELSKIAGVSLHELIEEKLQGVEIDLLLKPQSLIIYFVENKGDYSEYYYTDAENIKFIVTFEESIFSFSKRLNPVLN